jgi:hypothetical protein
MAMKTLDNWKKSLKAVFFGVDASGLPRSYGVTDTGEMPMAARLPVAGAAPTAVVGTLGRLNQDLSYAIAAGKTISFHPLQHGVSVSVASGGAAAVLATGRAVVFTEKSDDTTTLTAMLALLAASNAAGLVGINLGTAVGADTWNHLLTQPDTALWASGTIPAQVAVALYPDGYQWPLEVDATGGLKVSQSSALSGENGLTGSSGRIWTQVPGTGGTVLTDSGTLYASPCRVIGFLVTTTTVATAEGTFTDGTTGGTVRAKHFLNALGTQYLPAFGLTVGTDLCFNKGTAWVGSIVAVVDPAV